jgi:hypothetical protein
MKKIQNISAIIVVLICICSLIRVGYSIFPIIIIPLQILVLIVNNQFTFAFFDRTYNVKIHKKDCIKILQAKGIYGTYKYNDIVVLGPNKVRYLGKNWFKVKK